MVYSPPRSDPMSRLSQLDQKIDEIGRRSSIGGLSLGSAAAQPLGAAAASGTSVNASHEDHIHTGSLSALTDASISSPASGQLLTYNGTKWVNTTAPAGNPGLGRIASLADTQAQGTVTTEAYLVSLAFNAVAGRRYKIDMQIWYDVASGSAGAYNLRYAAGSGVTTSGTLVEQFQVGSSGGLGQLSRTFVEMATFSTGVYTVGLFGLQTLGSGAVIFRNGTTNPTRIYIEDVGT